MKERVYQTGIHSVDQLKQWTVADSVVVQC